MDYYAIGQRIRKIRKARGLSQEQLAERIGISTTHMSHIETANTKLSLPVFVTIAEALDVRADDLLYDSQSLNCGAALHSLLGLLDSCSRPQLCVLEEIVRAAKSAIDTHL